MPEPQNPNFFNFGVSRSSLRFLICYKKLFSQKNTWHTALKRNLYIPKAKKRKQEENNFVDCYSNEYALRFQKI